MVIRPAPAPTASHAALDPLRLATLAGVVLAALLMTLLLTSFQPFISGTEAFIAQGAGPNRVNQLGYTILAALSLAGMAMLADRTRLAAAADPAWLIIAACLLVSALQAADPAGAVRGALFNLTIL